MDKNLYVCLFLSFIVSTIITLILIPVLRRLKFGQTIRDEGPKWHTKKSGTPTMGGIGFLIVAAIFTFIFTKESAVRFGCIFAVLYGVIGFLDDGIKIFFKRNLGLNEMQKLILQVLVSVVFLVVGINYGFVTTEITIPYIGFTFDMGWFYIIFMAFYMVGYTNAVNLTDGLDGLAAGVTSVVCVFFAFCSIILKNDTMYLAVSVLGALLGFLIFNYYPAKIFMGDTGSLFLGGTLSILAILLKLELLFLLAGIVYVLEALSVVIQVSWYKKTKKRVFLMTPIHHHFEMLKMKETSIVGMFTAVALIACILSAFAVI